MPELTQEEAKEWFEYEPETGELYRIRWPRKSVPVRIPIRAVDEDGYRVVRIKKRRCAVQRLVWLMVYGRWPTFIDHINHVRHDNRLCNLREATKAENNSNRSFSPKNTSGATGVVWRKDVRKWAAQIGHNRRVIPLGTFENFEEAKAARRAAELRYFGQFAPQEIA